MSLIPSNPMHNHSLRSCQTAFRSVIARALGLTRKPSRLMACSAGLSLAFASLLVHPVHAAGIASTDGPSLLVRFDDPEPTPEPEPQPEPQPEPTPEPQPEPEKQPDQPPTPEDPEAKPEARPEAEAKSEPEAEPEAAPAELPDEAYDYLAIINGRVHTVSGPVLHGATVLIHKGKIERVGHNITLPEKTKVIDAAGQFVYPGLVAAESQGIVGTGNVRDSTNIFNLNMQLALSAGITTLMSGDTIAKNTYGTLEGMTLSGKSFERISYSARNATRKREFIASLDAARQFQRDLEAYREERAQNPDTTKTEPRRNDLPRPVQSALRLIQGEATAMAFADQTAELIELAELADRYNFKLLIRGAREGWTIPGHLSRAKVDVIVQTRTRVESDDRTSRPTGSNIQTPAILNDHGVTVAVIPFGTPMMGGGGSGIATWGLIGRDLLNLNMAAAFAVRGGMTNDDAIRTITLNAAKILGVDHRVGSIEPGKDADLVITSGDLLSYTTIVRKTIVNGEILYDQQRDGLFSHVRSAEGGGNEPYTEQWPRRLGESW